MHKCGVVVLHKPLVDVEIIDIHGAASTKSPDNENKKLHIHRGGIGVEEYYQRTTSRDPKTVSEIGSTSCELNIQSKWPVVLTQNNLL